MIISWEERIFIMIGIYKYENKLNGHIYIGQSSNIEKRQSQHKYDALYRPERSCVIDQAIHKYGIDNFDFSIIEECSLEELNDREIYWIQYYNSYENGYNCTLGGKSLKGADHPRALLTEEDVWIIRDMYAQHIPRKQVYEIFKDTGITERGFKKVWDGENWPNTHIDVYTDENKAWHKQATGHSEDQLSLSSLDRAIKQDEIDAMLKDYNNGINIHQLTKKYNRDYGIIQKYLSNPVETKQVKYLGRTLKNINTGKTFSSISKAAKWAGCGATTLTRHLNTDKIAGKVPDTGEPAEWIEIL